MRFGRLWATVLGITAIVAGIAIYGIRLMQEGFSVREKPSRVETLVARELWRWAIPSKERNLKSQATATPEILVQGRNHWADHCATCHANNGSGETEVGRNLYPKAPDMRQPETQSLSDGELYYIIRNGIRMTGMPAWGKPEFGDSDSESWELVLFIRHLPHLTADEEKEMEKFNPKSNAEREEEKQEEDFLNGNENKKEVLHER
jgi:mono/diheme cytochrome c family protein